MAKRQQVQPELQDVSTNDESERIMTNDESTSAALAERDESGAFEPANVPTKEALKATSGFKFKRTAAVAMPLFKLLPDQPRFFLVDAAIYTGKKIDDKKEAALLMPVTDLESGEQGQIIVGQVLKELIYEKYPEKSYVGKKFEVTLRKRADKKYNTYDLYEVEVE
jgi:hypothetical protein